MMNKEMIMEMLWHSPLSLLAIKDKQVIDYLNNLIPYSSAFETECNYNEGVYNVDNFKTIPDIMDVQNDAYEQRYRIPNGLKGIICLYNISTQLKINSELNMGSGNHYHIDCTDCWKEIRPIFSKNKEWITSELQTWLNKGETVRDTSGWFQLNGLQTIEYRLGEMTFDYKLLLKRIIHCNQITKKLKDEIVVKPPTFEPINANKIIEYLKTAPTQQDPHARRINKISSEIEKLQEQLKEKEQAPIEDISQFVRKRTHLIKPSK